MTNCLYGLYTSSVMQIICIWKLTACVIGTVSVYCFNVATCI
jgi:hypothetical protein